MYACYIGMKEGYKINKNFQGDIPFLSYLSLISHKTKKITKFTHIIFLKGKQSKNEKKSRRYYSRGIVSDRNSNIYYLQIFENLAEIDFFQQNVTST